MSISDRSHSSSSEPAKPANKIVRVVVWIVALAVIGLAFYLVLRKPSTTQTAAAAAGGTAGAGGGGGGRRGGGGAAVTLTSGTAQKGDIGVYLDSIGTVVPVYTSSITSQVSGIVTAIHYTEGQLVKKGDPLIDIDSRPYEATLHEAQGVLERDQGVLAQAQMDLTRYQAAWDRNAIPKQTLDDQSKLVDQDKGTVHNDEGVVQYDQIQVDYCHIVSPITGRVGLRLVDPGNVVQANAGTVLAVVTQIQPITTVFTLAEDSLGQLQAAQKTQKKLEVDAFNRTDDKQLAKGQLLTLDNQIDTTTGTVKARASFANKDSSLFPNQFVNTRLLVDTLKDATLIPSAAVQHNGQAAFVYVITQNRAHLKPITVGVTNGNIVQVDGVNPGDVLATSSFDKLQDNTPVTISNGTPGSGGGRSGRSGGSGRAKGSSAP